MILTHCGDVLCYDATYGNANKLTLFQEHAENFVSAIAKYVQRKVPSALQGPVKEEALNVVNIPKDALVQLVYFLKGVSQHLDPALKEPIETIVRNFQPALQNMAPKTAQMRFLDPIGPPWPPNLAQNGAKNHPK